MLMLAINLAPTQIIPMLVRERIRVMIGKSNETRVKALIPVLV